MKVLEKYFDFEGGHYICKCGCFRITVEIMNKLEEPEVFVKHWLKLNHPELDLG